MYITLAQFRQQMQSLHDSDFRTIDPDEHQKLLQHPPSGGTKYCMITFDDGRERQYLLAAPVLEQWHLKGVFFIMTIALNKPGYL